MDVQKLIKQIAESERNNKKMEEERDHLMNEVQMSEERLQKKYDELKKRLADTKKKGRQIRQEICELETKKRKLDHDEKLIDSLIHGEVVVLHQTESENQLTEDGGIETTDMSGVVQQAETETARNIFNENDNPSVLSQMKAVKVSVVHMEHQEEINKAIESQEKVCEQNAELMDKVNRLKKLMRPDVEMTDQEMIQLVKDVEELKVEMEENKKEMKRTQREFMTAHSATLEVLGAAGELKVSNKRFNTKGQIHIRCMLCTMGFDDMELRRQHILVYHWKDMETTVSSNIVMYVQLSILIFLKRCEFNETKLLGPITFLPKVFLFMFISQ